MSLVTSAPVGGASGGIVNADYRNILTSERQTWGTTDETLRVPLD